MLDFTYKLHKDPIPSNFAYCVQRGDLETAAEGLALPEITVQFNRPYFGDRVREDIWRSPSRWPLPVITVHCHLRLALSAAFSRHEKMKSLRPLRWDIYISPVPRWLRQEIREACNSQFLLQMFEWTLIQRADTWLLKSHTLSLQFSPESRALSLVEKEG